MENKFREFELIFDEHANKPVVKSKDAEVASLKNMNKKFQIELKRAKEKYEEYLRIYGGISNDVVSPEMSTENKLPEIDRNVAHPQAVWFNEHWRPVIEQLKAENKRLNKLAEGILAREESILAEHKLRIEIESENSALKSKLEVAKKALVEIKKTPVTLSSYFQDKARQALTEIGGEI